MAVVSLAIGGIILVIAGMALNAWYLLPKYSELYGLPMDTLIAMGTRLMLQLKMYSHLSHWRLHHLM